jgi:peptide chain release factor 2
MFNVTDVLEGKKLVKQHITFLAQGQYAYGYLKSESGDSSDSFEFSF